VNAKRRCATEGCRKPGVYLGRVMKDGQYHHLGYFCSKKERTAAQVAKRAELNGQVELPPERLAERITCGQYADEYVERMERGELRTSKGLRYKDSSVDTTRSQLRHFKREYGDRPLAWLDTDEAMYEVRRWAEKRVRNGARAGEPAVPPGALQSTTTLVNQAVAERLLTHNPFKGLGRRIEGRANERPPTDDEFAALLNACDVLEDYADEMRAVVIVGAYSLMRPGELMALTWEDVDLDAGVIHVRQRFYRGRYDLPKSNQTRTVALLPQAREALLSLPHEREGFVFRSASGKPLRAATLSYNWRRVRDRAGVDFDFYLATKHYGVHHMKVKLGLPNHDIAVQAGWSESSVERMVATYAHADVGALDRIRLAAEADTITREAVPA
jgi:integrase